MLGGDQLLAFQSSFLPPFSGMSKRTCPEDGGSKPHQTVSN